MPFAAALVLFALAGCGHSPASVALPNLLPEVQLTAAPRPNGTSTFVVSLSWSAFAADGQVQRVIYAVDPPVQGDTLWTATIEHQLSLTLPATTPPDPRSPQGTRIVARDMHTFAIRAVDNQGGRSPVVTRSFTATTVAPETVIDSPSPTRQLAVSTLPTVTIRWHGFDVDGATRTTPVLYKYRLVPASDVQNSGDTVANPALVQEFFGKDRETGFATWDSTDSDHASYLAQNLTPGRTYLFAVIARDEAGAYEPRFLLDANTLFFKPTLQSLGPRITLSSQFYSRTQSTGGIITDPSKIPTIEIPQNTPLAFHWSATTASGSGISGYRWAVDIEGGDITNETSRRDDSDVHHWSSWSLGETQATVGPFPGNPDTTVQHFLFVEARDQVGFVSLFALRLSVIAPKLDRPLLVIDDMQATLGSVLSGPYPFEAEQDTFHFAVGGVPDRLVGGVSAPGAFAGFPYDTLDYRFFGRAGVPLSLLGRYRVVAWYTDNTSSSGVSDSPLGGNKFSSALRYANVTGHLNTLAVYLEQGGKAFLFGDGTPPSIANGFWYNEGSFSVPFIPYVATPSVPRQYVLRPGCFLYDYLHIRSELNTAGTVSTQFTRNEQIKGAIPYLPEFSGPATDTDRSLDPRIGPAAARNVPLWEGLPRFTMASYRGAPADPAQRSINLTWYISKPLRVVENGESVLDTLYLLQARGYTGNGGNASASDAMPNAIYYHGSEHGPVVWFGFPMYFFERDQARQAVATVLRVLGVEPRN
jgi:hypothetical protein